MTSFNALQNNLEALSLTKMKEILPGVIEKSIKTGATLQDSLTELTNLKSLFEMIERRKSIL